MFNKFKRKTLPYLSTRHSETTSSLHWLVLKYMSLYEMDSYVVYIYCDQPNDNGVMEFQLLCVCASREDALTLAQLHTDTARNEEYPFLRGTEYDAPFREDFSSA